MNEPLPFKHIGLFEGIGGFSLAARWMGWETLAWCEWNEFGQRVLKHHFPEAEGFGDITKTDFLKYANRIDILTGGFPCQPYSVAGKRKGKEDERHLWPEMLRAIKTIQPTYVVGENVSGLISWDGGLVFDEVQSDLETAGYEVWAYVLPACAKDAPHRRDRVWFVAYSKSNGDRRKLFGVETKNDCNRKPKEHRENDLQLGNYGKKRNAPDTDGTRWQKLDTASFADKQKLNCGNALHSNSTSKQGKYKRCQGERESDRPNSGIDTTGAWDNFPTQPAICNGDDGLSSRLDAITFSKWRNESIKAGGNAIVPQVAFEIYKAIDLTHRQLFTNS